VAVAGACVLTGCGDTDADAGSEPADVYILLVRDALDPLPPTAEGDPLPVVYVLGVGEEEIGATVQADVASELREEADIRFADHRDEAVLEDEEGQPVRDHGVLLAVGEVPPEPEDQFDVDVEVYRSESDRSPRVVTIDARADGLSVTSTSLVATD
jgi:hypothetical protein